MTTVKERRTEVETDDQQTPRFRGAGSLAIALGVLVLYLVGWALTLITGFGYQLHPWWWIGHAVAGVLWVLAIVLALLKSDEDPPEARRSVWSATALVVLLFFLPALAAWAGDQSSDLFGNNGPEVVTLGDDFMADQPECEAIEPGTYAARDSNVVFEFAATPPLSDDPETMLTTLFTDILCEDEVNVAMHMTGMKEAVQLEGQSTATQGNALAALLGESDEERTIWRNARDTLWERWTTSQLESIGDFSDMVEDGDANLLCQNPAVDGRPRIVQLDDVVLSDLEAQVGNDLHAFLINRGDAPGFEDGRVAFLTDIGCFAFDEETFGEDVDNVQQAEHGMTGEPPAEEETPVVEDEAEAPVTTVAEVTDEQEAAQPEDAPTPDEEKEQPSGDETGDTTGPGDDDDGTTGEPGGGGECEEGPDCPGEDKGPGGGGDDDECPGDKCPDTTTSTTVPSTTTSTTVPKTTTTTAPTTTTTKATTTTTAPSTTTTTKATTTTTAPTTTSTTEDKGPAPCSPFDPECKGSASAESPTTSIVVMGVTLLTMPASTLGGIALAGIPSALLAWIVWRNREDEDINFG